MNDIPNPLPVGATGPRKRRGLRIVLVLSLMLNVLMIGVLAGGAWRVARMDPGLSSPDFRAIWRALPDHARDELRRNARRSGHEGPGMPPTREERRARAAETGRALVDALRASPFDAAHFAELMGEDREAHARHLDAALVAFAAQVANLSAAEREAMAARLADTWRPDRPRD